jgi:hypothetical protein
MRKRLALGAAICLLAGGFAVEPAYTKSLSYQPSGCGSYSGRRHLEYAIHREFESRIPRGMRLSIAQVAAQTAGNIILLEGDASIISEPNPFDLRAMSLAFTPSQGKTRYRVGRNASVIEPMLGDVVRLGDDDTLEIILPFEFPFYGNRIERLYLNSDGNLTFLNGDKASTERSLQRFLSGPPRIALFFADLDPSQGGTVRVAKLPERVVVTWEAVPEFDETNQSTFQAVLEKEGRILLRYGESIDAETAVVGISPGNDPRDIRLADLSSASPEADGAIAEKFQKGLLIDNVGTVRKFYESFPDDYDSIVVWTTFTSDLDGAFAFEVTTRNDVLGIGDKIFNDTTLWGSEGGLQSYIFMGDIERYPSEPDQRILGAGGRPTTLGLLAHEFGHRWLARIRFDGGAGSSDELLGRQSVHWSFFMDSDASFLEGNDIQDEGDRRFRTVLTVSQYSRLDLYLMGFAPPEEVAPFFFIRNGTGITRLGEPVTNESSPQQNIVIRGDRQTVLLDDVLRAAGARQPDFQASPKNFRQAWIILYRQGNPPSSDTIARIDTIRAAWEPFFRRMTLGRASVNTMLER